jgi:hypothetical protein
MSSYARLRSHTPRPTASPAATAVVVVVDGGRSLGENRSESERFSL